MTLSVAVMIELSDGKKFVRVNQFTQADLIQFTNTGLQMAEVVSTSAYAALDAVNSDIAQTYGAK